MTDQIENIGPIVPIEYFNPMTLLSRAIDKGIGADELAKLTALVEHWQAQRAKEVFNIALNDVQKELPIVVKDAENPHTRSKFARLETVQKVCRPVFSKPGFALVFGTKDCPLAEHVRITCDVRHIGGHVEVYQADIPLDGKGSQGKASAMNAPQATGSTYSYGQRYLLKLIGNVTIANEDNDANGSNQEIATSQANILKDMLRECPEGTEAGLCKWLNVPTVDEIPASRFKEVEEILAKKKTKVTS